MKIILGSASPRRKNILASMGYECEVIPADIDEKAVRKDDPKELVLALANAKADAILPKLDNDSLLITSDSVVVFEDKIIEKPQTIAEAKGVLRGYGTKPISIITAVAATNTKTGKRTQGIDAASIYFKPFTEELIEEFAGSGRALGHAGAFAAQDALFRPFIKSIEGSLESIMGLPKELTQRLIEELQ